MKVDLDCANKTVTKEAKAVMKGRDDKVSGEAQFIEYDIDGWKYVRVVLDLKGDPEVLTPGPHAVHIHEKADCSDHEFKCAGGHFDPGPSGNADPDTNHGYHAGDLPMIIVDQDGVGHMEAITTRVSLSDGPVSILSAEEGTSLMVHANPDPYTPGESGSGHSGGPRLACGVIEAV